MEEMRFCHLCKQDLHISDFQKTRKECKSCSKELKLLYRYGITMQQYMRLLKDQNGVCAICEKSPEEVGVLAVDHDHRCCAFERTCGKCIRGLLCDKCNRGLGYFMDSMQSLDSAKEYVLSWTN